MWVDHRDSLSTVYNDGEISTCGQILEVRSVPKVGNDGKISTHGQIIEVHLVQSTVHGVYTIPPSPAHLMYVLSVGI